MLMLSALPLMHASPAGTLVNQRPLWINERDVNQRHAAQVCGCENGGDTRGRGRRRAQQVRSAALLLASIASGCGQVGRVLSQERCPQQFSISRWCSFIFALPSSPSLSVVLRAAP